MLRWQHPPPAPHASPARLGTQLRQQLRCDLGKAPFPQLWAPSAARDPGTPSCFWSKQNRLSFSESSLQLSSSKSALEAPRPPRALGAGSPEPPAAALPNSASQHRGSSPAHGCLPLSQTWARGAREAFPMLAHPFARSGPLAGPSSCGKSSGNISINSAAPSSRCLPLAPSWWLRWRRVQGLRAGGKLLPHLDTAISEQFLQLYQQLS